MSSSLPDQTHRHRERRGYVWLELGVGAFPELLWNEGADVFVREDLWNEGADVSAELADRFLTSGSILLYVPVSGPRPAGAKVRTE